MGMTKPMSKETRRNWLVDAALAVGAVVAILTGIYFLFLPSGGYQGGRNPMYGITILFDRHTWDDLHTWGGVAMIAAAVVHFTLHWSWVANTAKRMWKAMTGKGALMNRRGYFNVVIDLVVAVSFALAALSGVYFLFVPGGRWAADPNAPVQPDHLGPDSHLGGCRDGHGSGGPLRHPLEVGGQGDEEHRAIDLEQSAGAGEQASCSARPGLGREHLRIAHVRQPGHRPASITNNTNITSQERLPC